MTSGEIAIATASLLLLALFVIASSVFIAIVVTEIIEERHARRKHKGASNECT
mgnify:CR=1 FL=1